MSTEKLDSVHPILKDRVLKLIDLAKTDGYSLTVTTGLRSFDEQNKLFAQKNPVVTHAKGGQSYHNYGLAVDVAFLVNGITSWNDLLYVKIGAWAKIVNLEWGGNWRKKDLPHVQLPGMPNNAEHLLGLYKAKGVEAVWNSIKLT